MEPLWTVNPYQQCGHNCNRRCPAVHWRQATRPCSDARARAKPIHPRSGHRSILHWSRPSRCLRRSGTRRRRSCPQWSSSRPGPRRSARGVAGLTTRRTTRPIRRPTVARKGPSMYSALASLSAPTGAVLTNKHVVHASRRLVVQTADGKQFPVKHVRTDRDHDVALLTVEAKADLPSVSLGDWKRRRSEIGCSRSVAPWSWSRPSVRGSSVRRTGRLPTPEDKVLADGCGRKPGKFGRPPRGP